MVLDVSCDKRSVVVDEFKLIAPLAPVNLDGAVAVGAVNGVAGFLVAVEDNIRITDRARVFLHGKAP